MNVIRRGWSIGAAALLVAGASLLPWFRTGWADGDGWDTNTATAWTSSTWWAIAVIMCLLAAGAGLFGLRPGGLGAGLRWSAVGLAATAAAVTVVTWVRIPHLVRGGGMGWAAAGAESRDVGDIVRDDLVLIRIDGLTQQVGWGVYAGLAAMVVLTAALVHRALRP
ncbi:hypothetical protein Asp14428_74030 [Actinoplanes sp. NBRC 14428]|uniref:Uncharacterized protein n=1 Tax=Pseudosporangium ferrugineum TaxID=439699 RepID=A0A2T0RJC3_9ACTN|nr:hypothetical protein [Pseudosporangium ferrugineum]PRY21296.1 hypothetical protein CLV70_1205 [Pseudosporangium ferrugineum]BCJ55928.1 hypothetical protein Asp14428_74030 [Actinoplanes sp. NBRC 14428]